jgi:hypothetical protein
MLGTHLYAYTHVCRMNINVCKLCCDISMYTPVRINRLTDHLLATENEDKMMRRKAVFSPAS